MTEVDPESVSSKWTLWIWPQPKTTDDYEVISYGELIELFSRYRGQMRAEDTIVFERLASFLGPADRSSWSRSDEEENLSLVVATHALWSLLEEAWSSAGGANGSDRFGDARFVTLQRGLEFLRRPVIRAAAAVRLELVWGW